MLNTAAYLVLAVGSVEIGEDLESGNEFRYLVLDEHDPRWKYLGQPAESTWAGHREDQCDCCGAHIRYFSVVEHSETGDILTIGLQCTSKFLGGDWTLAKARLQAKAISEAVLRKLPSQKADAVRWADGDTQAWFRLRDDAKSALKGYSLKDWQWERLLKGYIQHLQKTIRFATGAINAVPTGRVEVSGLVVSVKQERNPFGSRSKFATESERFVWKVTVQDDRGFRVWGTLPASAKSAQKGDAISFTATLAPSDKDPEFGTFSRPANATLGKPEAVAA